MLERERDKEGENEECLECRHALCLQGCVHPLHSSEREKEREKYHERERERKREREGGERGRERKKEREREKKGGRERVFIFKRNDGCLGTF
jgi:hypothetical protein